MIDLRDPDRLATPAVPFTVVADAWRNPMTVIRGSAETLDKLWEALDDEQRRSFVRAIVAQSETLHGWIERVLLAMNPVPASHVSGTATVKNDPSLLT